MLCPVPRWPVVPLNSNAYFRDCPIALTIQSAAQLQKGLNRTEVALADWGQHIAARLRQLSGTRAGGFVLTRQKPAGKWGAATYSLVHSFLPQVPMAHVRAAHSRSGSSIVLAHAHRTRAAARDTLTLGALLDAVVEGLRRLPETRPPEAAAHGRLRALG